jgi:hypothetical protein
MRRVVAWYDVPDEIAIRQHAQQIGASFRKIRVLHDQIVGDVLGAQKADAVPRAAGFLQRDHLVDRLVAFEILDQHQDRRVFRHARQDA